MEKMEKPFLDVIKLSNLIASSKWHLLEMMETLPHCEGNVGFACSESESVSGLSELLHLPANGNAGSRYGARNYQPLTGLAVNGVSTVQFDVGEYTAALTDEDKVAKVGENCFVLPSFVVRPPSRGWDQASWENLALVEGLRQELITQL
ncbi:hypothetical protein H6P81_014751 [Aristolochia fimbriata]|uniref:Uncharacterized protein n=1 Tax=Aristolochia fimbriata TaxID=158543 RepID=A0AAV7E6D3_ARIFI|nr:hypothetical protein H6P81_014751 [Aristolochia fimbriata]